jgi:hypothetical protein
MLPNSLIVRTYLLRGAKLWLFTRIAVAGAFAFAAAVGGGVAPAFNNPLQLSPVAVAGVVALSVGLAYLDTRRHRESILLGNLGVSQLHLAAMFIVPAIAGEIVLGFLLANAR